MKVYRYLKPSGDETGITDMANIRSIVRYFETLKKEECVLILASGVFYVNEPLPAGKTNTNITIRGIMTPGNNRRFKTKIVSMETKYIFEPVDFRIYTGLYYSGPAISYMDMEVCWDGSDNANSCAITYINGTR